jgi:hypothetical protein
LHVSTFTVGDWLIVFLTGDKRIGLDVKNPEKEMVSGGRSAASCSGCEGTGALCRILSTIYDAIA